MANPSNKVIFYPLQRLDKNDVDAVQSLAHNHVDSTVGALLGVTGVMDPPTITVDNTTEIIYFSDFSYLGMQVQHEGQQGAQSAFMGYYSSTDSANTSCSFDAERALVQAYYNANGSLPPTPLDTANYVEGSHGQYYPYIYVGLNSYTSDTEQRMFWSTADAVEVAQNVATRQGQAFNFKLAGLNAPIPTGAEYPYVAIARINSWQVNSNVVDLYTVTALTITDNLYGLAPYQSEFVPFTTLPAAPANFGGLARALHFIKARQDSMMDGGTLDPAGSPSIGNAYNASLSLAGLTKRLETEELRRLHCSATIISLIDTVNGVDTLTVRNNSLNDFDISAFRDFTPLLTSRSTGGTTLTAPIAYADYGTALPLIEQAINSIAIRIPSEYADYALKVSFTPIYPALTNGEQYSEDGQTALASTTADYGYDAPWFIRPSKGHNMDPAVTTLAWLDSINKVSSLDAATKADGSDRSAEYGFCIMSSSGIDDLDVVNTHELYHRYVKVDITLIKP